jgi:hypothetical protein
VPAFRPTIAVAAAVMGLAAGCGSGAVKGAATQVVARAPDATAQAGPAQVEVDEGRTHAEGVVNLAADKLRLTVTTTAQGTAGSATQLIAIGPDVWTRTAGAAQWTHASGPAAGLLSLPGLVSGDARALVGLVRGTSSITPYGGVQVRSFSTIRYDLKTDPQLAARNSPADAPQLLALAAAVDHTVRLACYVDDQNRIRRIEAAEDLTTATVPTRDDASAVVATVDFVRFGVADDIAPPPPGQVG